MLNDLQERLLVGTETPTNIAAMMKYLENAVVHLHHNAAIIINDLIAVVSCGINRE